VRQFSPILTALTSIMSVALSMSGRAQAPSPKIQVMVIGVTDFPGYDPKGDRNDSDTLGGQIKARCAEVENFFRDRFKGQVNVTPICEGKRTTAQGIRNFLDSTYRLNAAGNLSLLFLMSHGEEANPKEDSMFDPDLRIITEDTPAEPDDEHSLTMSQDVFPMLVHLPPGATVFAFIDTCHAGKFMQNKVIKDMGRKAEDFGIQINVLAATLPSEETYGALFTEAVLTAIGSGICLSDQELDIKIKELMKPTALKLNIGFDALEGLITPLSSYSGQVCLNAPNGKRGLVLLYAGPGDHIIEYKITGETVQGEISGNLNNKSYVSIPLLLGGEYDVQFTQPGSSLPSQHVILSKDHPAQVIPIGKTITPVDTARALQKLGEGAEMVGLPKSEVSIIRQRALAIYLANGETQMASSMLDSDIGADLPTAFTDLAGKFARQRKDSSIPLKNRVEDLVLSGQFALAGDTVLASLNNGAPADPKLLKTAFYAYNAAGDSKKAEKISAAFIADNAVGNSTKLDLTPSSAPLVGGRAAVRALASQRLVETVIDNDAAFSGNREALLNTLLPSGEQQ